MYAARIRWNQPGKLCRSMLPALSSECFFKTRCGSGCNAHRNAVFGAGSGTICGANMR